jgi:aspartate/methionine/tyrosine aminotransferase
MGRLLLAALAARVLSLSLETPMKPAPFKLERYFAQYEFQVEYSLCSSDCESLAIRDLLSLEPGAADSFQQHWLGYTESPGAPSLRREISRIYTSVAPGQVLVHSGAEEAIFLLMHAALSAGDHVIVQTPCYQSLVEVAREIGCHVTPWEVREVNGWTLEIEDLKRDLRPNTRLVVINTPHNPTGYHIPFDVFREINRVTQERGILLFSDEVYRELEYAAARLPAACDINELAVSLGVMSKTYGLAGLRIGWIATRQAALLAQVAALKDYTTICNSAPSEFLAELALRHRAEIAGRNLDIIQQNLALLDDFFARHPETFIWRRPVAGPIAFPGLLGEDVDRFCHELVSEAGVLLLPGTLFDDAHNRFRIGFGRKNMPEAVARLEAFLAARGQ